MAKFTVFGSTGLIGGALVHVELASKILNNSLFDSFLYISSTRIYEKSVSTKETEDIAVSVAGYSNFYNLTKILGESLVLNRSNNRGRIARLSYVVDDLQLSGTDPVSSIMSRKSGQSVRLSHHSESQKDYIFLSEAIDLLIEIALRGQTQIYNVASGKNISFNRIKSLAKQYLNVDVELDDSQQVRVSPLIDISVVKREFKFCSKEIEHFFKGKGTSIHV